MTYKKYFNLISLSAYKADFMFSISLIFSPLVTDTEAPEAAIEIH